MKCDYFGTLETVTNNSRNFPPLIKREKNLENHHYNMNSIFQNLLCLSFDRSVNPIGLVGAKIILSLVDGYVVHVSMWPSSRCPFKLLNILLQSSNSLNSNSFHSFKIHIYQHYSKCLLFEALKHMYHSYSTKHIFFPSFLVRQCVTKHLGFKVVIQEY